jgi:hypothetical protein
MRLERYGEWMRRCLGGQLGFGDELWAFPSNYPTIVRLRKLLQKHGRNPDLEDLTYYASRDLIVEVIEAAGAVEYAVQRLEAAAAEAQKWVIDNTPPRAPGEARPQFGEWAGAPTVRLAYLDFNSAVVWVRGMQERLDRGGKPSTVTRLLRRIPILRGYFPAPVRAGLVNVLAEGRLRNDVRSAHARFLKRTKEARLLANFGLHASRVQQNAGTSAAEVLDNRTIVLRMPDRVTRPVEIFDEFTFTEGREIIGYTNDLLTAVDDLIDALLDAFERARPVRFG